MKTYIYTLYGVMHYAFSVHYYGIFKYISIIPEMLVYIKGYEQCLDCLIIKTRFALKYVVICLQLCGIKWIKSDILRVCWCRVCKCNKAL